jgi:hypothetical protein
MSNADLSRDRQRLKRELAAFTAEKVAAEPTDFVFPPMPPAIVMHDKLGPLFDRLSMHFYAYKCMTIAAPQQPAQSAEQDERREAKEKAAEFMIAARNATMFQDVRELISTLTDPKANCPGRNLEARRVLPLLDAFLGEGYTGRVLSFKRALERAESEGPEFEDGPDESGFKGPRPWNGFSQSAEQDNREIIRELQKALFYWMPRIAGEDSPAGQKAAEHSYLLVGLDDNSTECWGDQILHYVGTLNREQEKLGLVLSDAGCTEDDDYLQFIENLAARATSTQSAAPQPVQTQVALTDERAAFVSGRDVEELFLRWSEWTTELGEAISRKNIDGFVSDLRSLLAAQPVSGGKS